MHQESAFGFVSGRGHVMLQRVWTPNTNEEEKGGRRLEAIASRLEAIASRGGHRWLKKVQKLLVTRSY